MMHLVAFAQAFAESSFFMAIGIFLSCLSAGIIYWTVKILKGE